MEETKQLIERRVILPLSEPELASRHSVSSPKAILLFGPPGTGKTTFAKAIGSHLDWEHYGGGRRRATTDDFLAAIHGTRRTLTDEMVTAFHDNTERFARC